MNEFILPTLWLALAATLLASVALWNTAAADSRSGDVWTPSGQGDWRALARPATWVGSALLVAALFMRWQTTSRPPWTNMWEFTVAFAAAIALTYLGFGSRLRAAPLVGGLVQCAVAALLLAALLVLSPRIEPLVPALQSEGLLGLHVGFMVASYGALSLSFCAAALRLLQGDRPRPRLGVPPGDLDRLAHGSVVVGFPLLTAGVLLGAYWANQAWGRYWAWDPKETAALVTWLIYGAYLHVNGIAGWSGRRSAALLVVGFVAILFTFIGVSFWLGGLHSYT